MKQRATCPECSHQFDLPADPRAVEPSQAGIPPAGPVHFPALATTSRPAAPDSEGRPRRTAAGLRLRLASAALLLLLGGTAVWLLAGPAAPPRPTRSAASASPARQSSSPAAAAARQPPTAASPDTEQRSEQRSGDAAVSEGSGDAERPRLRLAAIERAIVKIESDGPGNLDSVGTGFVIDSSGLVATSYHVMAEHTEARATFKDGLSCPIAGYVALAPEVDLAIVQLRDAPSDLATLPLRDADDLPRLAPIVAVGHPRGLEFSPYDGRVSRILSTSELPAPSRRFLEQTLDPSAVDHRWIQHTAQISPGNSGGPLLDEEGQVVGVNTWVDQGTGFSYALHVRHLRELWDGGLKDVASLDQFARPGARLNHLLQRLSVERLEQLLAAAERMNWKPASGSDYETLQHLAWAVTVVQLPGTLGHGEGLGPGQLDQLRDVTDRILQRLRARRWDEPGQITIINEYAARHVGRPLAGVFLFGTVRRVVEDDQGTRACLMALAGTDQMLLLPLEGQLIRLAADSQCLVLGVNYNGHVVRYGDNPLRLITADVIASRAILVLE